MGEAFKDNINAAIEKKGRHKIFLTQVFFQDEEKQCQVLSSHQLT